MVNEVNGVGSLFTCTDALCEPAEFVDSGECPSLFELGMVDEGTVNNPLDPEAYA